MRKQLGILIVAFVAAASLAWAGPTATDLSVKESVESRLDHAKVNQHGNVLVTYEGGVVTLNGTVDSLAAKLDAEKAAEKTKGVTRVVDNLQVRVEDLSAAQIVRQAYHEIVTYYAYGIFDYVNPEFQNGTLIVNGYVTQPFKKGDLQKILERVRGVAAVQNNLEVLPASQMDDRLRLQLARAIYGNSYFTAYTNMAVPPIHIIVKSLNVMLEGVVNSNMDRVQAGMRANTTGLSFSVVNNLKVVKG